MTTDNKHLIFESKEQAEKIIPVNVIRKIKIDDKMYGLANTPRGFKVFDRSCPHAGADLSTGRINYLGELVCPLHAYTFSFLDGEEERDRCPPVRLYNTVWEEGKLFVFID